jgi:hypothetical protein
MVTALSAGPAKLSGGKRVILAARLIGAGLYQWVAYHRLAYHLVVRRAPNRFAPYLNADAGNQNFPIIVGHEWQ